MLLGKSYDLSDMLWFKLRVLASKLRILKLTLLLSLLATRGGSFFLNPLIGESYNYPRC